MYDSAQWLAKAFEYLSQKTFTYNYVRVCGCNVKHFEIETRCCPDHIDKTSNESYIHRLHDICRKYVFSKKIITRAWAGILSTLL